MKPSNALYICCIKIHNGFSVIQNGNKYSFINKNKNYATINNNNSYLGIPVLFLKITGNKIRIIKTIDRHIDFQSSEMLDIGYFIETIVSLKKFVTSFLKIPEMEMSY